MIKVAIIGGAGYTAGELIRIIINHPDSALSQVVSSSQNGRALSDVHRDLEGEISMKFTDRVEEADVVFLCAGHGKSEAIMQDDSLRGTRVIDLSADFRLNDAWHYGLPELGQPVKEQIANPGCFATAIQLALLPLASEKMLANEVHVHAITGSTGAGQAKSNTTHFSWRHGNVSIYKAFEHQHLAEINRTLGGLQGEKPNINFIPVRGAFTRGIFATAYMASDRSVEEVKQLYQDYYNDAAFTFVSDSPVDLKQVVNTNKCLLHATKHEDKVLVTSVIDNLLKGASGQAVQNMNLMFGLDEKAGLHLKPSYF